jgi:hypothetical protein
MAVVILGPSGDPVKVDKTHNSGAVSVRPMDHGSNGVYRASALTAIVTPGLAANVEVFQFRWTDATKVCLVQKVTMDGFGNTSPAFTAGLVTLQMAVCRSWTAMGVAGTVITTSSNSVKIRTSHATSTVSDVRTASTSGVSSGTKTIDSTQIGGMVAAVSGVLGESLPAKTLFDTLGYGHPLVLDQNEGINIRATIPGSGQWQCGFTVHWTEATAY